jgi:hypothetical protein
MKKIKILFVCLSIAFYSCSKSDDSAPTTQDPNGNNPPTPDPYAGYDIYASGEQANIGVLWKNGKILYSDPMGYSLVRTGAFCVSGNDIYEGANKKYRNTAINENNYGGCILKNGTILYNDTGASTAIYDIVVLGNDVYYLTGGSYGTSLAATRPKLWKNGQVLYDLYAIANVNNYGFRVFSLQIVNNNIYVGAEILSNKRGYFKNGVFNQIIPINFNVGSLVSDILVVTPSEDIYYKMDYPTEIGLTYPTIRNYNFKIFKNGAEMTGYQTTINKTYAKLMKVIGNDVYILGDDNRKNVLWKNGVRNYLPDDNATNVSLTDRIYDFNIVDNKTFIAGKIQNGQASVYQLFPQVWELTSSNTNIVAHQVEVTETISNGDLYAITRLVVVKK